MTVSKIPPNAKSDRNAAMVAAYNAGATFSHVAAKFGVSRSRVCKIVYTAVGRRSPVVQRPAVQIADCSGSDRLLSALWAQHPGIVAHLTKRVAA